MLATDAKRPSGWHLKAKTLVRADKTQVDFCSIHQSVRNVKGAVLHRNATGHKLSSAMPSMRQSPGKRHFAKSKAGNTQRGAKHPKKTKTSAHHQLQLLHKSIKKAKQFELRKLIRRLKTAASASQGTSPPASQAAAPSSEKLQAQYNATKSLDTETALREAAASCGLMQDTSAPSQNPSQVSTQPSELNNKLTQLAVTRLLSATCVRQQLDSIKEQQQQQQSLDTAVGTVNAAPLAEDRAENHETRRQSNTAEDNSDSASDQSTDSQGRSSLPSSYDQAADGAEEDQQIADAVMARLLKQRADNAERSSLATSSSSQSSEANTEESMHTAGSTDALQAAAGRRQDASGAAVSLAAQQHFKKRKLHAVTADDNGQLDWHERQAAVKPSKKAKAVPKKKKNRLGQRARQQLGRAKQGQQLGFAKQEQQMAWQQKNAGVKPYANKAPVAPSSGNRHTSNHDAKPLKTEQLSRSEPMHPSWQAKQKQKQAMLMAAPAGRKTVFAEDGQAAITAVPASKPVSSAKVTPVPGEKQHAAAGKLHPSWHAKRSAALRQAELASRPQASKIVFAD